MGLGLSKTFAFVLIFAIAYSYWLRDISGLITIMIPYIIIKIIWRILTQK